MKRIMIKIIIKYSYAACSLTEIGGQNQITRELEMKEKQYRQSKSDTRLHRGHRNISGIIEIIGAP
jgi:hypothetical protein